MPQLEPMSAEEKVAAQMRLLRERYLENLREQTAQLDALLAACEAHELTDEARAQLKHVAHKLAGTGKTYGFPQVSEVARRLDDRLIARPDTVAGILARLTQPLVAACREALQPEPVKPVHPVVARARAVFGRRPSPQPAAAPEPARPQPGRLPVLLVADDDEAVRNLFLALFADEARVITALNSDEALTMMRRYRPDLVLLDDIMPGAITGLRLLEGLQRSGEFASTPILMITASDGEEHVERGLNAGAVGYVTKPFDAAAVARTVRALLADDSGD